jgi:hypothetical protein
MEIVLKHCSMFMRLPWGIPLGDHFRITPSIRYRSLSRDIEINEVKTAADLNYISAGVGFAWLNT